MRIPSNSLKTVPKKQGSPSPPDYVYVELISCWHTHGLFDSFPPWISSILVDIPDVSIMEQVC